MLVVVWNRKITYAKEDVMEEKMETRKIRGAWVIRVREANTGQGIGGQCDQCSSESTPYHDKQRMDKKRE